MIIFTVIYIRRNVYDLHHAILGILFSVLIAGVLTDAIMDAVDRPRPNFFWCCFPDGIVGLLPVSDSCHGIPPGKSPSSIEGGIILFPLLVAAMIAISRVDDYWHHWQDVCTGGVGVS